MGEIGGKGWGGRERDGAKGGRVHRSLSDLLLYFEKTYVGGPVQSDGNAFFPPSLWSMYEMVLESQDKTNNIISEAWNRLFKEFVGKQNPSFWSALEVATTNNILFPLQLYQSNHISATLYRVA